jgi:hypothetical protein
MPDFLDEKRREIQERLKELRPLVDEYHRLEAADRALSGVGDTGPAARPAARRSSAKRSSGGGGTGKRGRPKGTGTRAKEALAIVGAQPGITIPELAEAMGIKQNYLYRVMPDLAEQGQVVKSGRGWHLRNGANETEGSVPPVSTHETEGTHSPEGGAGVPVADGGETG